MKEFAERLRHLRQSFNMTQEQSANILGISRGMLSNYELGTREPDLSTLLKLAIHYETTVDYLLGRTQNPSYKDIGKFDSYYFNEIVHNAMLLTDESQKKLAEFIQLLLVYDKHEKDRPDNSTSEDKK